MIEESSFTEEKLKKEVLERYGIEINKIKIINKGTANIYKVFSNDNIYVIKEFQSKYSKDDVLREINAIEYLRQKSDIPLPEYIKCKNGELYFLHKQKVSIIQKFIEGKVFNKNEGNYEQLIESAYYLGKIIDGFRDYKTSENISIKNWYSKEEIEKANQKYNSMLEKIGNSEIELKIKEDILFKKKLLQNLEQIIDFSEINKITHKVSHGDYSNLQFIYNKDNKVKAILDFIKVKRLPIVWEIARSYSYIDKEVKNGELNINNIVDYTKEVSKVTELNKYDLKYLPYVYLIQLARSTFGYDEYFKDVKNKEELLNFAFYRTNICRNLYKQSNEISNRLLEIKGD
jgi:Ser/Thr protein kinase RdoA (MazF antagonist)